MTSRNRKERTYIAPPVASGTENSSCQGMGSESRKRRKREANLYDAVAGRVTSTLPLDDASDSETTYKRRPLIKSRDPTLAPEEVLFRRAGAPIRYVEKDIYHSHESLPDGGRHVLPDSDMLKALHSYSTRFYAAMGAATRGAARPDQRIIDERSLDETALLAFGILLEEAGREILGEKGDLVLTEGVQQEGEGEIGANLEAPVGFLDALPSRRGPDHASWSTAAEEK